MMIQVASCDQPESPKFPKEIGMINAQNLDTATLGAGCFWCVEAIFEQLNGVHEVES